MTKIYLANSFRTLDLYREAYEKVGFKRVLLSYFILKEEAYGNKQEFIRRYLSDLKESGFSIFLDSGAFSLFEKGFDDYPGTYVEEYINFVKENEHLLDVWAVPDVINNFEKTYKYAVLMSKRGVDLDRTVYVVHRRYEVTEKMVKKIQDAGFSYIGLSLSDQDRILGLNRSEFVDKMQGMFGKDTKMHFFGVGSVRLIMDYRPYSADVVSYKTYNLGGKDFNIDGSRYNFAKDAKRLFPASVLITPEDIFLAVSIGIDELAKDIDLNWRAVYRQIILYRAIEKITSDDEIYNNYMKAIEQGFFDENFYKSLRNFLYSLDGSSEVFDTPRRWVNALTEYLSGYRYNPYDVVGKTFEKVVDPDKNEKIVVKVPFSSMCVHHLLPFYGYVKITYIPSDRILGLSKFSRLVHVLSRRLQVQEKMTEEIYKVLYDVLKPKYLSVKVKARHLCSRDRGIRTNSVLETEVSSDGGSNDREG